MRGNAVGGNGHTEAASPATALRSSTSRSHWHAPEGHQRAVMAVERNYPRIEHLTGVCRAEATNPVLVANSGAIGPEDTRDRTSRLTSGDTSEAACIQQMSERTDVFRALLEPLAPGRLLDLATGHGSFALTALDMGWEVTAVDARDDRLPSSDDVDWIQADVRDFDVSGYDAIAVLGLLYHLELSDQRELLKRCAPTLTIIDTHVSLRPKAAVGAYLGHYFDEYPGPRSSWGNAESFWLTEDSLYRLLLDCGFGAILKVLPYQTRPDRTFFVAAAEYNPDVARLTACFNASSKYRLEPQLAVGSQKGAATVDLADALVSMRDRLDREVARLRQQRDNLNDRLDAIESRRSVRAALRLASFARPVYELLRIGRRDSRQ